MAESTRVAVRGLAVAAAVVLLAAVHVRRPPTLCVLRATTGLPCPFCGGTTAAVDLGHGRLSAAVTASPLAVLMLFGAPFLGVTREPLVPAPRRSWRVGVVAGALAAAEIWQLHRFGLIRG